MGINYEYLKLPAISIKKVHDSDLKVIYYDLYLDNEHEGRYDSIHSLNWRLCLLISEEAMNVDV